MNIYSRDESVEYEVSVNEAVEIVEKLEVSEGSGNEIESMETHMSGKSDLGFNGCLYLGKNNLFFFVSFNKYFFSRYTKRGRSASENCGSRERLLGGKIIFYTVYFVFKIARKFNKGVSAPYFILT